MQLALGLPPRAQGIPASDAAGGGGGQGSQESEEEETVLPRKLPVILLFAFIAIKYELS